MTSNDDTEIEWLKGEIIPKLLRDQKLLKEDVAINDFDKFQIKNITLQIIGAEEAFMLTKCYRARIEYGFKGDTGEINIFVKRTPPQPQEVFDAINFKALFTNEILAYEKIIPALEGCGKINLKTAKFYYGDLKSNAATTIIEDFGIKGWRMTKDKYNLSLEHILLAVKYLADFHALGFALSTTDRSTFDRLTEGLEESRFATDEIHPEWALTLKYGLERSIKSARKYQKTIPHSFLDMYGDLFTNSQQYCRQLVRPKEPYVTLCHGDYLRNNVAYKYAADDEDCQHPLDIMMFDLQTMRVSSPMLDLVVFLCLSTLTEVRYQHFEEIFRTYCNQLKQSYEKLTQLPVPDYLSYEPLLKEYIRFLPYGILACASFLMQLVEPHGLSAEELLNRKLSDEEVIRTILTRGGEMVDRELAHQLKEFWDLAVKYNVTNFS